MKRLSKLSCAVGVLLTCLVAGCPATPPADAGQSVPGNTNDNGNGLAHVDADRDGVEDTSDACLNTPLGESVTDAGCAIGLIDSDGDGFSDDEEVWSLQGTDPFDPTDNPNNVRDTDADGCSDYDEVNFDGFCDNNPNTL